LAIAEIGIVLRFCAFNAIVVSLYIYLAPQVFKPIEATLSYYSSKYLL